MSDRLPYEDQRFRTAEEDRPNRKKKGGGIVEYLVILVVSFALVFGFVSPFVVDGFSTRWERVIFSLQGKACDI